MENAAGNLYERSLKTFMKDNMLIYCAYADFEEVISNAPDFYAVFSLIYSIFTILKVPQKLAESLQYL